MTLSELLDDIEKKSDTEDDSEEVILAVIDWSEELPALRAELARLKKAAGEE
ncbi:MAG: hypothetical protein WC708_01475 [Lentisphaeria bacterium]|jgi:hypothetical protein